MSGWVTSERMHHDVRPTCIFGCEGQKDNLKHYLECPSLWNPIFANVSLPWIESPLARLAFLSPTRDNFVAVAVAFVVAAFVIVVVVVFVVIAVVVVVIAVVAAVVVAIAVVAAVLVVVEDSAPPPPSQNCCK